MEQEVLLAILESIIDPIVFVDTTHTIRYLNKAAIEKYKRRGKADLAGKSVFECHHEKSKQMILDIFQSFLEGENERFLVVDQNCKIFMRAVRDPEGKVIGYYERFEKD